MPFYLVLFCLHVHLSSLPTFFLLSCDVFPFYLPSWWFCWSNFVLFVFFTFLLDTYPFFYSVDFLFFRLSLLLVSILSLLPDFIYVCSLSLLLLLIFFCILFDHRYQLFLFLHFDFVFLLSLISLIVIFNSSNLFALIFCLLILP